MKKIALILGGGVSLGSYVGGAVTELVLALRHNESDTPVTIVKWATRPNQSIYT